jgi:hypothetical protein
MTVKVGPRVPPETAHNLNVKVFVEVKSCTRYVKSDRSPMTYKMTYQWV